MFRHVFSQGVRVIRAILIHDSVQWVVLLGTGVLGVALVLTGVADVLEARIHTEVPLLEMTSDPASDSGEAEVVVEVLGAVEHPGVYVVPAGTLIAEAIQEAGGFTDTVDVGGVESAIHLAHAVEAGQKIVVPHYHQQTESQSRNIPANQSSQISINTASKTELMELAGIGEKRAANIIEGRPYFQISELLSRGILSESLFTDVREQLQL